MTNVTDWKVVKDFPQGNSIISRSTPQRKDEESCFASVDLEETVEFNRFFQIDWGKLARQEIEQILPPK